MNDADYYAKKRHDLEIQMPSWRDMKHANGAPLFKTTGDRAGMMLDDKGNRSIFDDIDD